MVMSCCVLYFGKSLLSAQEVCAPEFCGPSHQARDRVRRKTRRTQQNCFRRKFSPRCQGYQKKTESGSASIHAQNRWSRSAFPFRLPSGKRGSRAPAPPPLLPRWAFGFFTHKPFAVVCDMCSPIAVFPAHPPVGPHRTLTCRRWRT